MNGLQDALVNLGIVIITGVVSLVSARVTRYFKEQGILETFKAKEQSVKIAVDAVEQIAKIEKVPDKFKEAQRRAVYLLNEQGIQITDAELKSLIEAAVLGIQQGYEENK